MRNISIKICSDFNQQQSNIDIEICDCGRCRGEILYLWREENSFIVCSSSCEENGQYGDILLIPTTQEELENLLGKNKRLSLLLKGVEALLV
jgi:hypothetical protein